MRSNMTWTQRTSWTTARKTKYNGKVFTCEFCGKEYLPNHKYSKTQVKNSKFCSNYCKLKRKRDLKVYPTKKCKQCNKDYVKKYWTNFCSPKCTGQFQRKKDGMTKDERYRRKKGMKKQGSEEWLEKIRMTTKDAMYRPDINIKLRQKRVPMSIERKIKQSNALAGRMPENMKFGLSGSNAKFCNVQRGYYECSKGEMYFRSKWEANYALYLDFLVSKGYIKTWEFEPDCIMFEQIKLGTRSYRPDFKVFLNSGLWEYHEVKGYMDNRSITKLKRMAKYYPEIKLILIDKPVYEDIRKKLGKVLGFY